MVGDKSVCTLKINNIIVKPPTRDPPRLEHSINKTSLQGTLFEVTKNYSPYS